MSHQSDGSAPSRRPFFTRFRTTSSRLLAAAVASVLALGLSACSSGGSDSSGDASENADYGDLTVQLSWIKNEEFAGEFFADSKGYYTDAGFSSVNLVPGPSTGAAELLGGDTDVALSDAVSIGSVVASESAPLKIIGATYQKNPFSVLSLKDGANIATPQDLVGKKIGVQASNTNLFNALLSANGIDASQVTVVPVEYDPSVLINGDVDGYIAYLTNESITVASQGHEVTNLPFAENGLPFVAETFTVTDQTLSEKRDAIKAFLIAEIKGWTDNYKDPEAGAKLAVETYGKDLGLDLDNSIAGNKEQLNLISTPDTESNGLFTISDELQDESITSLKGAGITVTKDQLFDTSLIDEIYSENPDLKNYK